MDRVVKYFDSKPAKMVGMLQALFQLLYIGLVGILIWNTADVFDGSPSYFGPILMLTLLSVSVLISGIITLGYPFVLFWVQKKPKKAIKIVVHTAVWLLLFVVAILSYLLIFN